MSGRALLPLLLLTGLAAGQYFVGYQIPTPRIEALKPRGLRISIPDDLDVELFAVHVNVNKPISRRQSGQISADITEPEDGRWVYEDRHVRLKPGDVINYWLYVKADGTDYRLDGQTFTVKELVDPDTGAPGAYPVAPAPKPHQGAYAVEPPPKPHQGAYAVEPPPKPHQSAYAVEPPPKPHQGAYAVEPPPKPHRGAYAVEPAPKPQQGAYPVAPAPKPVMKPTERCDSTVTTVNGKPACKGQVIFEDTFATLNPSKWQHDVQLAGAPDYQFVVYTASEENTVVKDGKLFIKPTLLAPGNSNHIYTGKLDLRGCTSIPEGPQCQKVADAWSILPPVKSAKLNTKLSFSFAYGVIEVRAKLPLGDWLFPEIRLEPKENFYGRRNYESGQITIAMARGNEDLTKDGTQLGNQLLEAGCRLGLNRIIHNEMRTINTGSPFASDFHVYKVIWTPDELVFSVDGTEIGKVRPPIGGFDALQEFASSQSVPWKSELAPFDREFYISLGVGVGGNQEFPDGCMSHQNTKPWRNKETKSMLFFYDALDKWHPTWDAQKSSLEVDYVKVWAL